MPAIQSDAALLNDHPEAIENDDAFMDALFGKSDEDKDAPKEPSENADEDEGNTSEDQERNDEDANDDDASDENPDDEDNEGDDADEDKEDDKTKGSKKFADGDETYVKIKVGDEEHEVKVTDLKRLFGQEAALTRKSQEVSAAKVQYDEGMARNVAAYDVMLKRANERANEYRKLPWTQLMKDPTVDADQLAALQADAQRAFEDEAFLKTEADGFMQKINADQLKGRQEAARECIKSLNDTASPNHIKGWNEAVYNDIRTFATEQGVAPQVINSLTDPAAIKILHMALQFKRGSSKVVTTKVNKTPTKIVKTSASAPATRGSKTVVAKQAVAKAMKSGNANDAVDAFEAMFD